MTLRLACMFRPGPRTVEHALLAAAALVVLGICGFGGPLAVGQRLTQSVTYPAGWSIIAATQGTMLTGMVGPLYTYQDGDAAYRPVSPGLVEGQFTIHTESPRAGVGYWAYFSQPTTIAFDLGHGAPLPNTGIRGVLTRSPFFGIEVPLAHWVMIGNPWAGSEDVIGADAVYVYDSTSGYRQTTTLAAGQGAFVYSTVNPVIEICGTAAHGNCG